MQKSSENFRSREPGGAVARRSLVEAAAGTHREMSNHSLAEMLSGSSLFREFQQAFEAATGLPLTLRAVESWALAHANRRNQNAFCALLFQSNRSCAACLEVQQRVCGVANRSPATLTCDFGLCETSVGVRIGEQIGAYLQTGQVFFKPPTSAQTRRAVRQIREWGLDLDPEEVLRCYEATPVVRKIEYEARIKLLQFFADQLGALANQIVLSRAGAEPAHIRRARDFIATQYGEKITLAGVARQVNVSASHFCKGFTKAVGVHFTGYVSRVRVEKAKHLLLNFNYRVGEIAFEVGFQSVSHFNRAFRKIAGESPTAYRRHLVNPAHRGGTASGRKAA